MIKKLQPVEVEWIDAQASLGVISISELEKEELLVTKSCGYLINEDKQKVVLGFMLFGVNNNDELLIKHYQVIPKGMIIKITKLKEVKNGK